MPHDHQPQIASQDSYYEKLVAGFINFNRWPLAKKYALATTFSIFFQGNYLLTAELLAHPESIFDITAYRTVGLYWLLYSCLTVAIAALVSGRGRWSEWLAALFNFGYATCVLFSVEALGGSASSYALFPMGISLIAIFVYGPRLGFAFALYILCGMLALMVAHHQGWLPVAYSFEIDSIKDTSEVTWHILLGTVYLQFTVMLLALGTLIFAARDRAENALLRSQAIIRRYLPPAVADQIIAGNETAIAEPRRQRLTIMFADIVGFTNVADRVEPEVMTEVLNTYLSNMVDIIEQHGGTLNEFAGDGLMALWGAPNSLAPEDQARQAINAAQAMQAQMPVLNEQWRKLGLGTELKARIGINTGMVSVGSYGSQGRMTYTAIGLQTNIASRIESKAEPGETLISDASYQLIRDEINCEPKGEVECKGVHYPVKVYQPVSV